MIGPQTIAALLLEIGDATAGKLRRRARIIRRMRDHRERRNPKTMAFLTEKLARTESELRQLCKQCLELLGE